MDKKSFSWALYDWANSAYSTTVMAGFFPIFFKQYWSAGADAVETTARLGTVLSVSSFLIAVLSPILGALADQRGLKKAFCGFFMVLSIATCFWLAFIPQGGWPQAMWAFGIGMFTFAASAVFYDAMLPSLASGTKMDDVSSFGYAIGYLGGGVLFAFNVLMFLKYEWFGLPDGVTAVRLSFASVGVWWFLFSIPLFKNVPEPAIAAGVEKVSFLNLKAHMEGLLNTARKVMRDRNLMLFLVAYWLYIDGIYTVMTMAVDYGLSIGLKSTDLIVALLLVQFVGFPFTWLFGKVTGRFGCRAPVIFGIVVYSLLVIFSTQMQTALHFYLVAATVGAVQGGVQSLSRSLLGNMVPTEESGEFYGLFNLIGKFGSIIGPIIVAITVTLTKEPRYGMVGLLVLFVSGGYLLWKVREPVAARA